MELWFTEKQTKHFGITARINRTLHTEQTEFQKLDMVETEEFGNMLILDGMVMTTEKDEFVYHEMVAHVPLFTHPNPENVLVVGGGDGGVIREVLKHPSVKKATLVEIDGKVIEYSKQYLPSIAGALDNERVEVKVGDGFLHIAESENEYDVIMVDSTEPVGPGSKPIYKRLLRRNFKSVKRRWYFRCTNGQPLVHTRVNYNCV
ncbi:spermidine synthase [Bacillus cereus]